MNETINADYSAGAWKMAQKSLTIVRNSIFAVTVSLAAVIITLPSGAADNTLTDKLGAFSGLASTSDYNPALLQRTSDNGDRYRLNTSIPVQDTRYTRSVFSVKFDQKNLLPLAATSRSIGGLTQNNGLKKRTNITLDRDRSLLADYRLNDK